MNQWELIRLRCLRDKQPIMQVAREFGVAENTVRKYVRSDQPPTKIKLKRSSILDEYQPIIDDYLKHTPKITSRRIGALLRERHGLKEIIGECMMRRYISRRREMLVPREAFIRAEYEAGDQAQFDFSPMKVCIAGREITAQIFVMRLSYSGYFFARASLYEDQPSLFCGLNESFLFFGGLPRVAVFDNAKTAVTKVHPGRKRFENETFQAFRGSLALQVEYAAPAKGNEKGGVEGMHGYIEDNFFRPIPHFESMNELNESLYQFCLREIDRMHSTHKESVRVRFDRERVLLRALPQHMPKPTITGSVRVNKFSEITINTHKYSVPTKYAFRQVSYEISEDTVCIMIDGEIIATHQRSQLRNGAVIDPLHYVGLLLKKHRAAHRAFALAHGRVPDSLQRLYTQMALQDESSATKQWTRVLALGSTYGLTAVAQAAEVGMSRGCIDSDSIELIVRQSRDPLPGLEFFRNSDVGTGIT